MTDLRELIKEGLERQQISARKASTDAGQGTSFIKNILSGHSPSFDRLEKLFAVLGINLTYSFDEDIGDDGYSVPLLEPSSRHSTGFSDEEQAEYIAGDHDGPVVSSPPDVGLTARNSLFAMVVQQDDMKPFYNPGDHLFFYADDPLRLNLDRLVGRDCAVTLPTGQTLIKRIRRPDSGRDGFWNLEAINPLLPLMTDQTVTRVLSVRHVTRRF